MFKWQLNSTLASFLLLADYPSVSLTSENLIMITEDYKYLISIQNQPDNSLHISHLVQIIKFLPDNHIISYFIYFFDTTNKANIDGSLIYVI